MGKNRVERRTLRPAGAALSGGSPVALPADVLDRLRARDAAAPDAARRARVVERLTRRPGLWLLVLAALALAAFAILRTRGPVVTTTQVVRKDIEQHLVASGRVRVVTRVALAAQVAGRIVAIPAVEGRRVAAGELLVQLEDSEARAEVAQARALVGQASSRLEQVRKVSAVVTSEARRQAATNLERAEEQLARMERLLEAGAVARADVDDARRNVEIARARKASADAEASAAAAGGTGARTALNALRESEARLAAASSRLGQTRILAPQDGVVLKRLVEPGDSAQPGMVLIELAADGQSEIVIEPDERNLAWIRVGQAAAVSADAFPDQVFDARVCYIAPAVDPSRGSVEVRLCVPDPPPYLRADMTVSVDLTVASKSGVLTVPSEAVRDASTAAPWVLVVNGRRVQRQSVALGIRGEGQTEIVSGLEEGVEIVTGSGRVPADGDRVRPRREDG